MKTTTLAALFMCSSIFMVEAAETNNSTARATAIASRKNSSNILAYVPTKDKKKQTENRKKDRTRREDLQEKGEDHFFYRD